MYIVIWKFPGAASGKEPSGHAGDVRDTGLTSGLGRSPGEGNGNPFQYSCLKKPMDRGAWQAIVHRVAKGPTQVKRLSTHTCILTQHLEWVMTLHRCLFSPFEYILLEQRF